MKKLFLYSAFICGVILGLANCSKSGGGSNSGPAVTTNNICTAGSVYTTQYGCLPTANCTQYGANYGWYSGTNQCIQGTTNTTTACGTNMVYSSQYGCVSQCGVNSGWVNGQCVSVNSTTCAAGQIYSSFYNSCLQQCGADAGIYNGQCVYVGSSGSYGNGHRHHYHSGYDSYGGYSFGFNFGF